MAREHKLTGDSPYSISVRFLGSPFDHTRPLEKSRTLRDSLFLFLGRGENNMAALVQTIPQQSGTVPVLQTRPSSSSGTFSPNHPSRIQTMSWSSFNGNSGNYRAGHPVVAPYNYQNTTNRQSWTPHLRPEHRTFSAPASGPANPTHGATPRSSHLAAGSVSNSSSNSSFHSPVSKDDSALPSRQPRTCLLYTSPSPRD